MQKHRTGPVIALVVALPLLFVAVYLGVYYANLAEPSFRYGVGINDDAGVVSSISNNAGVLEKKPVYHIDSAWVRTLLRPAHRIDRTLRPGRWDM
jgi:hypothetical protein